MIQAMPRNAKALQEQMKLRNADEVEHTNHSRCLHNINHGLVTCDVAVRLGIVTMSGLELLPTRLTVSPPPANTYRQMNRSIFAHAFAMKGVDMWISAIIIEAAWARGG